MDGNLIFKDESYAIIGRCMEVHKVLGAGFLEEVYKEALAREFDAADIEFCREAPLTIMYKGAPLEKKYFADFLCWEKIVLEVKAVAALTPTHLAQTLNYLKATGCQLELLVNFGEESFRWHRIVHTASLSENSSRQSAESASIRVLNPPQESLRHD